MTTPSLAPRDLQNAAAALLETLRADVSPLRAISETLADLAARAGVDRAVLGIDDTMLGRQVFCSQRAPLKETTAPLFGPASLVTEPPTVIDPDGERLFIRAAEVVFATLHDHVPQEPSIGAHLRTRLDAAAAAATQFGWGFALVLTQCDAPHGFVEPIGGASTGDATETYRLDDFELACVIPAIAAEEIPAKLGQIAHRNHLPTMTFGVAMCPADGSDATALLSTAAQRLRDTMIAREQSSQNPSIQADFTVPSAP